MEYIGYKDPIGNGQYNMGLTDEEIIRCQDCEHYAGAVFGRAGYWCNKFDSSVKPDGFCAWAERRA